MSYSSIPGKQHKGTCPMDCECSQYAYNFNTSDVCYADGNEDDREKSVNVRDMGEIVWHNVKPPEHFPKKLQPVSARKVDIVRAKLTEKAKTPCPSHKSSMKSIGYYAELETTKSGVSIQSFISHVSKK